MRGTQQGKGVRLQCTKACLANNKHYDLHKLPTLDKIVCLLGSCDVGTPTSKDGSPKASTLAPADPKAPKPKMASLFASGQKQLRGPKP